MAPLAEQLLRMYGENPGSREFLRKMGFHFEKLMGKAASLSLPDLTLASLEIQDSNDLAILLAYLPAENVLETFGEDALFWRWVRFRYQNDGLLSDYVLLTGKGSSMRSKVQKTLLFREKVRKLWLLEKARLSAWRLGGSQSLHARTTMKTFQLLEAILEKGIDFKIEGYFSVPHTPKRQDDYLLQGMTPEMQEVGYAKGWRWRVHGHKAFSLYLDATCAIALLYKDEPQAVVSFAPIDCSTVMVYQLQGITPSKLDEKGKEMVVGKKEVKGHSRGLIPLRWKELLLDCVKGIAREHEFQRIGIRSGYHNSWTKPDYMKEVHLPLERALQCYDRLAENLGYQQGADKNWYAPL